MSSQIEQTLSISICCKLLLHVWVALSCDFKWDVYTTSEFWVNVVHEETVCGVNVFVEHCGLFASFCLVDTKASARKHVFEVETAHVD